MWIEFPESSLEFKVKGIHFSTVHLKVDWNQTYFKENRNTQWHLNHVYSSKSLKNHVFYLETLNLYIRREYEYFDMHENKQQFMCRWSVKYIYETG
jgi:hypothetical protein